MKDFVIIIMVFFISYVNSAWSCTGAYCKNGNGWGPNTYLCSAQCGSGSCFSSNPTNEAANPCDTTLVNCDNSLSAISHSFDDDLEYQNIITP